MKETRVGVGDHQQLPLSHLQAVIDIVIGHRQRFLKAAEGEEKLSFRHHRGRRHRADVLGRAGPASLRKRVRPHAAEHMTRHASADSQDDAAVLNPAVRVRQIRADRAHVRSLTVSEHLFHPTGFEHFRIIVEEEQVLSLRLPGREVVDPGVAEVRFRPPDDLHPRILVRQFRVEVLRCLLPASILDDPYFIVPVIRPLKDRADTPGQKVRTVPVRNQNRNLRLACHGKPCAVMTGFGCIRHLRPYAEAAPVRFHSPPPVLKGIAFAVRTRRGRSFV